MTVAVYAAFAVLVLVWARLTLRWLVGLGARSAPRWAGLGYLRWLLGRAP
jgi:hypothetical protein